MKFRNYLFGRTIFLVVTISFLVLSCMVYGAQGIRVLLVSDTEEFAEHYGVALEEAGAVVRVVEVPEAGDLEDVDVVLLYRAGYDPLPAEALEVLSRFADGGGGIVAVNAGVAAGDVDWGVRNLGGGWHRERSRKFTSLMMLYVITDWHPIVEGASPFDINDDTLYDLVLAEEKIEVFGSAFTPEVPDTDRGRREAGRFDDVRASIYDIQPQMWAFEGGNHRSVVLLQGAARETLEHPAFRAYVMRGLAWVAKSDDIDGLVAAADLAQLRYPPGGPRTAEDAVGQFKLQPGFSATSIAEEPMIHKPIAVQWDERGRLWVAESPEYPNGRTPHVDEPWKETAPLKYGEYDRPAYDSISILEDTNGDGRMDKKSVFIDGLELVTGFCFYGDGVIVVSRPNISWHRDTNGDGVADTEVPLFRGFGGGDTHFVVNHFVLAPDGWIYAAMPGNLEPRNPDTNEVVGRFSAGVIRFKPDGSKMQQVASIGGNSWGLDVTSDFEIFNSKATNGRPIQHVVLPEWVLQRAPATQASSMHSVNPNREVAIDKLPDRAPLMQIDQVGRYSAACSSLIYEGGALPGYEGMVFVTEPILSVVHHERVVPDGASFKGELVLEKEEWLHSMDYWFSPIEVTFGADGMIYVLDFYTPVLQHNDTRGPKHGRTHAAIRPDRENYFGRIYRIEHEDAESYEVPDLAVADGVGLVEAFRHPNRVVRFNALRVLMDKAATHGAAAKPVLVEMALGEAFAPARILALWALHRMGGMNAEIVAAAVDAEDAGVRKNIMLIAEDAGLPVGAEVIAKVLRDEDARVRLAGLRALGAARMQAGAAVVLLDVLPGLDNSWAQAAAAAAGAGNPSALLQAVLGGSEADERRREFTRSLAASLAGQGDGDAVLEVLQAAVEAEVTVLAAIVLQELGRRPPEMPENKKEVLAVLRRFLNSADGGVSASALLLTAAWDKERILEDDAVAVAVALMRVARDAGAEESERVRAVGILVPARSVHPEIMPGVLALLKGDQPQRLRRALIEVLAESGEEVAGKALAAGFGDFSKDDRHAAFRALIARPEWTVMLLDEMEAGKFGPDAFDAGETGRLERHSDQVIAARAKMLFAMHRAGGDENKVEIIARLLPEVEKPGNFERGQQMFTAACATCHVMDGKGSEFGPNLDGAGTHGVQELLSRIVDPNRIVDAEYRTWNIRMKDGTQYSGIIASENPARVQLRQPGGVVLDLRPDDIETRESSPQSLMPEGLEALGEETLRDIITYMRSLD